MTIDLGQLPREAREEIERLRSANTAMSAYLRLVEGALLAAWKAGEPAREALGERATDELTDEEQRLRDAWELVGEIVLRVPEQR
jgi:hypothetical protein